MTRLAFILLALTSSAVAQSGIEAPRAGCFVHRSLVYPVFGVAGNFVVGRPKVSDAVSAACLGALSVIKNESSLDVHDGRSGTDIRLEAPAGPALFALGRDAIFTFLPNTGELFRTAGAEFSPVALAADLFEGEPLAIGPPEGDRLTAVVRSEGGLRLLRVRLASGLIEADMELPGVAPPVLLGPGGLLLYADGAELVLRAANGAEERVLLPAPPSALEPMGERWIRILLRDGAGHFALSLDEAGATPWRLPEVSP